MGSESVDMRDGILLGMGNPLLDISATVADTFLTRYGVKANDACLAEERHMPMYRELTEKYQADYIAGGSVQNALRVAQWVLERPNRCTFFGCVGEDEWAKILEDKARKAGVNVHYQYTDKEPTGTCAVLITGHNRSLCANLAAANCFTIDHIRKPENKKLIEAAQFYYVSGFFLTVSPESTMEVAKFAHAHSRPFIMNLSAQFICQFYKEPLMQALPYVDVLFGNETEAETFATEQGFGTKDLKEIALKICDLPKQNEHKPRICIITTGMNPIIVAKEGKITEFEVTKLSTEEIVDTNGAGDAFVGGFLAQYVQGQQTDVCVKCGIWTAAEILKTSGCTYEGKATFKID